MVYIIPLMSTYRNSCRHVPKNSLYNDNQMYAASHERIPLTEGLTVRRQAAGPQLAELLARLRDRAVRSPSSHVELRPLTRQPRWRSVGINLLNAPEVRVRAHALRCYDAGELARDVEAYVPSLGEALGVRATKARLQTTRSGEHYVITTFSGCDTARLQAERHRITGYLDSISAQTSRAAPLAWLSHKLDLTLAYLPPETDPAFAEALTSTARACLPIAVALQPAQPVPGKLE